MKEPADPFLLQGLIQTAADSRLADLESIIAPEFIDTINHGDLPRWMKLLNSLPELEPGSLDLSGQVSIGTAAEAPSQIDDLEQILRSFIPWRKGPFELFGIQIDSEWRSDMKWERLLPHLQPLDGCTVLDVGCGNGYHCWRALGAGAKLVVGVEPYLLYVMQFLAIKSFLRSQPCYVLPIRLENYPGPCNFYDRVFSMGVIYHVRSPIDHLMLLNKCLNPGGQLVLETLIVDGNEGYCLTPSDRYARMPNVWFIPSIATLTRWLQRCGFADVTLVDTSVTTIDEQRTTAWMPFKSLVDGLDPANPSRTAEGLPAPVRAIVTAVNPA